MQEAIVGMLKAYGWFVKSTHGSAFSSGWPDLYAIKKEYGSRWIEVKLPGMVGSRFTAAQMKFFPEFVQNGAGIWILTAPTREEYNKLFQPCNWWTYLMKIRRVTGG